MLSKSLIQFSVGGWGCVLSLLFDLRPNYGGGNKDNGDLLQKVPSQPCSRPPLTHTSAGESWTFMGKSGSVSCGVTAPFSWVLVYPRFVCALQESVSPVLCKSWQLYGGVNGDLLQEGLCYTLVCCTQSPCPCSRPLLTRTSTGDTQTQFLLSLFGVFGSRCAQDFVCALQEYVSPVLCKFWQLCGGVNGDLLQEGLCHTCLLHPTIPIPFLLIFIIFSFLFRITSVVLIII